MATLASSLVDIDPQTLEAFIDASSYFEEHGLVEGDEELSDHEHAIAAAVAAEGASGGAGQANGDVDMVYIVQSMPAEEYKRTLTPPTFDESITPDDISNAVLAAVGKDGAGPGAAAGPQEGSQVPPPSAGEQPQSEQPQEANRAAAEAAALDGTPFAPELSFTVPPFQVPFQSSTETTDKSRRASGLEPGLGSKLLPDGFSAAGFEGLPVGIDAITNLTLQTQRKGEDSKQQSVQLSPRPSSKQSMQIPTPAAMTGLVSPLASPRTAGGVTLAPGAAAGLAPGSVVVVAPRGRRGWQGPKRVLLLDKLAFVLGSTCLWVCAFWLGKSPSTFYMLYTVLGAVLFTARFAVYRARKWHYYLLDLCYACNALLLAHLWVVPQQGILARATFAFNTGPLTTSILAFRNSLVYHDMDKVTSLFLHLVPACVSWSQRWFADPGRFGDVYKGRAGLRELVAIPLAFYSVWAVLYFLTIFVIAADRIKRRGYMTLFNYVTTQKRGAFAAIARRVPRPLHVPAYLMLHMCFCGVSMLLASVAWRSFALHTFLLMGAASLAIYHGGCYYFEVFASKRHQAMSAATQAAVAAAMPSTPSKAPTAAAAAPAAAPAAAATTDAIHTGSAHQKHE